MDGFRSRLELLLFWVVLGSEDLVTFHILVVTLVILIVGLRLVEFRMDVQ